MTQNATKKKGFYAQMLKLVIPIAIQNLLSAAVNSADVIMLNYVDQASISAVSLASQYAGVIFSLLYGIGTGATMLCSQYYGKKDFRAIQAVEGIAFRFSISFCMLFGLLAFFIPESLMRIFTPDEELIRIGASYLKVISIAYVCWGITEVYMSVLRSISRVTVCTILSVITFSLNILLNAVFIFGLFGAPKLGAVGVAAATSISRLVQLAGCFLISLTSKDVKLDLRYIFIKNTLLFQDFVRLSLPALANDVIWGLAFSTYSVILGHLGSDVVAANSFVVVVRNFGTVLCFGVASAGSILLGQILGRGDLEEARMGAKRLMKLTVGSGIIGGLIVLASIPGVLWYASSSLSATALGYLKTMLFINTYYIMGAAVNTTLIAGVFRAGGDSKFGFICDTIDMWCYAVPLGFLSAFVFKLPVMWVYFLLCTDEFVKWPWVLKRYKSEKWLKNITRDDLF